MTPPTGDQRLPPSASSPLSPARKREQLLARSAALRLQLARDSQVLVTPLALADKAREGLRWLRQHPQWPLAGLGLLVLLRPRRAWRWAKRGWWVWRLWQRTGRQLLLAAAVLR
jgi:hypothetical protein